MIISLRGTNGAGKSTIVRKIMDMYPTRLALDAVGRKKPIGYVCSGLPETNNLFVPGHYEIANGGLDTIRSLEAAYVMIRTNAVEFGRHVLYEGKNMTDGPARILLLPRDLVTVIHLATSLTECVASVRERGHSISEESIGRLHAKTMRDRTILRSEGVPIHELSRDEAVEKIASILQLR